MYELLILGALMVHPRTGYKLRQILEGNLEPRRQISNGVMYPLLHKLAAAGYIQLSDTIVQGREQKLATITAAGQTYFDQLMHTPIAMDAKRETTFRFKFRGLGHEPVGFQRETLHAYLSAIEADMQVYDWVIGHLHTVVDRPERAQDVGWALRTLALERALTLTKREWAQAQLEAMAGLPDTAPFTAVPDQE